MDCSEIVEAEGWMVDKGRFSFKFGDEGFTGGPTDQSQLEESSPDPRSSPSVPLGLLPRYFHRTENTPSSCGTFPSSCTVTLARKTTYFEESNICRIRCENLVVCSCAGSAGGCLVVADW